MTQTDKRAFSGDGDRPPVIPEQALPAPAAPALLVITGSTASGKESVACALARRIGGEIVVCDSVKPYRGLRIVSAGPDPASDVPHHLAAVLDPRETLFAARWSALAEAAIHGVRARGRIPIVTGGTALYLRSLLFGMFSGPAADPALRASLLSDEDASPGTLHRRLRDVDPAAASKLHPNDRKRIVRALEVHAATGRPISELQTQWSGPPRIPYLAFGLRRTREDLRGRIVARVDRMAAEGLFDEVAAILRGGPGSFGPTAAEAIGVKELLPVLRREAETGVLDAAGRQAALAEVKRRTWTFARRQDTWWRSFPGVHWLDALPQDGPDALADRIMTSAGHFGRGLASKP